MKDTNGIKVRVIKNDSEKEKNIKHFNKGEPYSLSESGSKMLLLYERDYKGMIPDDAYLILGNISSGSLDSTRFGLIGKNDILGKAELFKNGG